MAVASELLLCVATTAITTTAANTTTSAVVMIRPHGVCFWLTIDFGFLRPCGPLLPDVLRAALFFAAAVRGVVGLDVLGPAAPGTVAPDAVAPDAGLGAAGVPGAASSVASAGEVPAPAAGRDVRGVVERPVVDRPAVLRDGADLRWAIGLPSGRTQRKLPVHGRGRQGPSVGAGAVRGRCARSRNAPAAAPTAPKPPAGGHYDRRVTPADLAALVRAAVPAAVDAGELAVEVPDDVVVERPKNPEHGDYATNIALRLAKVAAKPPREVAELVAARLRDADGVARVDVAGPGFLNITLDADSLGAVAQQIVEAGGRVRPQRQPLAGQQLNLEFVSANPTGPVHIGGTRWAAVGDALARILQATGADVTREYYFNDHGGQIDRFARILLADAQRASPAPEDGYGGAYIDEIAAAGASPPRPDVLTLPDAEAQEVFRREGVELMFAEIKQSLHDFGVDFDVYFHENSLHESRRGRQGACSSCKDSGQLYFADDAWWLRSTDFGDDKDRVVIKSDGKPAYFAGDLAYLRDKRDRGFDLCIYLLGADHHGYIGRLKAAAAAFGDDPDDRRGPDRPAGQPGEGRQAGPDEQAGRHGLTLADLVDAVGVDAARYALERSRDRVRPSTSTSTCSSSAQTTTRSTTCSTRTPGPPRSGATPTSVGIGARPRFDPRAARPHRRRRAAHARWGSSRASSPPPPSCARRTASRTTSRRWPASTTAGTTRASAGSCRSGDEPITDANRSPRLAQRGHPRRAGQRAGPARRQRPGADVADVEERAPGRPAAR